jgi:predicted RNase H-like nuclease (RuvC/YqgF family)
MHHRWLKVLCLTSLVIVGFVFLPGRLAAQSTAQLESRLGRLESDNYQLRAEINRLQSQIYSLSRPGTRLPEASSSAAPTIAPPRPNPTTTPIVERLATLLIELKERVTNVEARMTRLERANASQRSP